MVSQTVSQFDSELFQELLKVVGFYTSRTTAYHPQTNGLVEGVHRTLKTAIMTYKESWINVIPIVQLGIHNIPTV